MPRDGSGNEYIEVESYNRENEVEHIRLTFVQNGFDGTPSTRIQVRDGLGHLRQGPEVPTRVASQVVKSLIDLLQLNAG